MNHHRTHPSGKWMRFLLVLAVVAAYLPLSVPMAGAIVTVDTIHVDVETGDDLSGDGSADSPYRSIGRGMLEAGSGDTVLVAPGLYDDTVEEFPIDLNTGVTLTSSDGAASTILDAGYERGLLAGMELSDVVIEGLTLTGGAYEVGGALLLESCDNVTLRDLEMTGNIAMLGGALTAFDSTILVEGGLMSGNGWFPGGLIPTAATSEWMESAVEVGEVASMAGGAVFSIESTVTLDGVEITDNAAAAIGGGVVAFASTLDVADSVFAGNYVSGEGGLVGRARVADITTAVLSEAEGYGGGICVAESHATIEGALFLDNEAPFGAGMHVDPLSVFSVTDSVFAGNEAFAGALTYFDLGLTSTTAAITPVEPEEVSVIDRCVFESNQGAPVAAVAAIGLPITVQNSLFTGNVDDGSTLWLDDEGSLLMNSTLTGNQTSASVFGPGSVVNSIVWGNESAPALDSGLAEPEMVPQSLSVRISEASDFMGANVTYTNSESLVEGDGNISADPEFADAEGGDFRLTGGSPCVDAGTFEDAPPYDLDGLARPTDGDSDGAEEFDMGAYELGAVDRIAGLDRYGTSVQISRETFDSADTVVIATGRVFADGLAGAGLAGVFDAPLLLTRPDGLPSEVKNEITRLGAKKAFVLGASSAVNGDVALKLKAMGLAVERIGGEDRYETAAMIAQRIVAETGEEFVGTVFVARGDLFPDALSVSPAAFALGAPTLLVRPNEMPAATVDVLDLFEMADMVIAGSEAAVGVQVAEALPEGVTRIGGKDRYATAADFSSYAVAQGWSSFARVGLATGQDFADALCGGASLGRDGGVLLLTPRDSLHSAAASVLTDNAGSILGLDIFGGPTAVDDEVRTQVEDILR